MNLLGEVKITAPRQRVWDAFNDLKTFEGCVPGCEQIMVISNDEMTVTLNNKSGPTRGRFTAILRLDQKVEPISFVFAGEGKGGAGIARGTLGVTLKADKEDQTRLLYKLSLETTGKLSKIATKQMRTMVSSIADDFFDNVGKKIIVDQNSDKPEVQEKADMSLSGKNKALLLRLAEQAREKSKTYQAADTTIRPADTNEPEPMDGSADDSPETHETQTKEIKPTLAARPHHNSKNEQNTAETVWGTGTIFAVVLAVFALTLVFVVY